MAGQTPRAVVGVSSHFGVLIVHVCLIVLVAVEARENAEVVRVCMARRTLVPLFSVFAREDGKGITVVIEVRPLETVRRVARQARRWVATSGMTQLIIVIVADDTIGFVRRIIDGIAT